MDSIASHMRLPLLVARHAIEDEARESLEELLRMMSR